MKRLLLCLLSLVMACAVFVGCSEAGEDPNGENPGGGTDIIGPADDPADDPTDDPSDEPDGPSEVTDIASDGNSLTFTGVAGADSYAIEFTKGGEVLASGTTDSTSLDLSQFDLAGNYTVTVYAVKNGVRSEGASATLSFLTTFGDIVLEAEQGLMNYALYRGNEVAHGGAYVGGIDNAGQGVYFNVFSYAAGTYAFDCYYTTGSPTATNYIYVNGEQTGTFSFTENTGWGATGSYPSAMATAQVTLEEGWNTIAVIKNGTESDNYGSFAELDYFVLHGDGQQYNIDEYETPYDLSIAPSYRLEGEYGAFLTRNTSGGEMSWSVTANAPAPAADASGDFVMGNINDLGQGVEWAFLAPKAGRYSIEVAYARDSAASDEIAATFYFADERLSEIGALTADELAAYGKQELTLGAGSGWGVPAVASETIEVWLDAGENFIYAVKEGEGGTFYFQIDYIELTYLGEQGGQQ